MRLLTRCVPFTSYLLTAKRLVVLGALLLLLWGAPGGVQPRFLWALSMRRGAAAAPLLCGAAAALPRVWPLSSWLQGNALDGAIPTELGLLTLLTDL